MLRGGVVGSLTANRGSKRTRTLCRGRAAFMTVTASKLTEQFKSNPHQIQVQLALFGIMYATCSFQATTGTYREHLAWHTMPAAPNISELRADIKNWERAFKATNARDPTIDDIKLQPHIGQCCHRPFAFESTTNSSQPTSTSYIRNSPSLQSLRLRLRGFRLLTMH